MFVRFLAVIGGGTIGIVVLLALLAFVMPDNPALSSRYDVEETASTRTADGDMAEAGAVDPEVKTERGFVGTEFQDVWQDGTGRETTAGSAVDLGGAALPDSIGIEAGEDPESADDPLRQPAPVNRPIRTVLPDPRDADPEARSGGRSPEPDISAKNPPVPRGADGSAKMNSNRRSVTTEAESAEKPAIQSEASIQPRVAPPSDRRAERPFLERLQQASRREMRSDPELRSDGVVELLEERRARRGAANCARYRTFDPRTGTYRGYDGRIHRCSY